MRQPPMTEPFEQAIQAAEEITEILNKLTRFNSGAITLSLFDVVAKIRKCEKLIRAHCNHYIFSEPNFKLFKKARKIKVDKNSITIPFFDTREVYSCSLTKAVLESTEQAYTDLQSYTSCLERGRDKIFILNNPTAQNICNLLSSQLSLAHKLFINTPLPVDSSTKNAHFKQYPEQHSIDMLLHLLSNPACNNKARLDVVLYFWMVIHGLTMDNLFEHNAVPNLPKLEVKDTKPKTS